LRPWRRRRPAPFPMHPGCRRHRPDGEVEETQPTPIVEFMAVTASDVAQNLQAFKNKGPGNKTGSGNTVGSSLQCFENDLPFTSAGNVAKQAQGQCTAAPLAPLAMSLLFSGDPTGPVVVQQD
jgi:hypothetical protein